MSRATLGLQAELKSSAPVGNARLPRVPTARILRRRVLYGLAESRRFHTLLQRGHPVGRRARQAAAPFLGGETIEEVLISLTRLRESGFDIGVDYFGEARADPAAAVAAADEYVRLNHELAGIGGGVNVWVDLTNIGLDVSDDLCREQLARIGETLPAESRLQIRAHDSTRIDRILALAMELADAGAPVMPTLQANLRRSPEYAARLIEAGLPLLLVKGAHLEPAELAHRWGEETDVAFVGLAHQLYTSGVELAIGTHDPVLREALLAALPGIGVEMLLGVRSDDARELLHRGRRVRLYVPFGDDWLRYWLRRLGEAQGA